ncbi:MAG: hypothetical protein V3U96_04010 [Paracoccaceae bacterium]
MGDVAELENRITAALDRIGVGLDAIGKSETGGDSGAVAKLKAALEAEKTANSQLEERVTAIKEKQEKLVAGLEGEVAKLRKELASHDGAVQKVKQTNLRLRENNRALRDANKQGVGDAELINTGMVAELDALRVSRETDRAELDAILLDLKPLVEGGANA